jgi:hypothetical protein
MSVIYRDVNSGRITMSDIDKVEIPIRLEKPLPVNKKCCNTCPFSKDPALATKVIDRNGLSSSQICHSTEGENREPRTLCRGMRDIHIKILYAHGLLDSPTDEAWEKKMQELNF